MQVHLFWPWIKVIFAIISTRDWKTTWSLNVVWATADLLPLGAQSLLVQLQRFRPPTNYCLKRLTMRKSESMPPTERRWKTKKKCLVLTQMHVTQIVRPRALSQWSKFAIDSRIVVGAQCLSTAAVERGKHFSAALLATFSIEKCTLARRRKCIGAA